MARFARIVVPDIPHHVTQRGNRGQKVFFRNRDRRNYLERIRTFSRLHDVQVWAYCLIDNHVHFVAVPKIKQGFIHCFQEAHRAYTRAVNFREGWRGYLWQGIMLPAWVWEISSRWREMAGINGSMMLEYIAGFESEEPGIQKQRERSIW